MVTLMFFVYSLVLVMGIAFGYVYGERMGKKSVIDEGLRVGAIRMEKDLITNQPDYVWVYVSVEDGVEVERSV